MAGSRRVKEVDGLSVVRVFRHAKEKGQPTKPPAKPPPVEVAHEPAAPDRKIRIGHTALPTKHEIVCYQCGYTFNVAGHGQVLYCAKCRTVLDHADYTLETECNKSIKTVGSIRLTSPCVLTGGDLTARDIVLEGKIQGGHLNVFRQLELRPGAVIDIESFTSKDLKIAAGGDFRFDGTISLRNVEICGTLKAKLEVTGIVTVRAGGCLRGSIRGGHMVVEEGGALVARLDIDPSAHVGVTATPLDLHHGRAAS